MNCFAPVAGLVEQAVKNNSENKMTKSAQEYLLACRNICTLLPIMRILFTLVIFISCLFSTPAIAQEEPQSTQKPLIHPQKTQIHGLTQSGLGTVTKVIDPLRLEIDHKHIVQLTSIDFPDFDIYDSGPLSVHAHEMMIDMLLNKQVRYYQKQDKKANGYTNRMGYKLVHLVRRDDNLWIQGFFVANGIARVRPSINNTETAEELMALENAAREEKTGLWADPAYAVLTPQTAEQAIGHWGIIEGQIKTIGTAQNKIYMNFGDNWRNDFTIGIESQVRRAFSKKGIDLLSISGKNIRVRGWVENYNGPYVNLMAPIWLEIIHNEPSEMLP